MFSYTTKGTCAREITFDLDEDTTVHNVSFVKGCNGNTKGIAALVEGMPAKEVVQKLEGITCGQRNTSCPDQLSQAIQQALQENRACKE